MKSEREVRKKSKLNLFTFIFTKGKETIVKHIIMINWMMMSLPKENRQKVY